MSQVQSLVLSQVWIIVTEMLGDSLFSNKKISFADHDPNKDTRYPALLTLLKRAGSWSYMGAERQMEEQGKDKQILEEQKQELLL